jgi:hypothetical protein
VQHACEHVDFAVDGAVGRPLALAVLDVLRDRGPVDRGRAQAPEERIEVRQAAPNLDEAARARRLVVGDQVVPEIVVLDALGAREHGLIAGHAALDVLELALGDLVVRGARAHTLASALVVNVVEVVLRAAGLLIDASHESTSFLFRRVASAPHPGGGLALQDGQRLRELGEGGAPVLIFVRFDPANESVLPPMGAQRGSPALTCAANRM